MELDFSGVKILVIGDPISDVYNFCRSERLSPEAPVPVLIREKWEKRWGGAANVWAQLVALGCTVERAWPAGGWSKWTRKERYLVGSHQIMRLDDDRCVPNTLPALDGFSAIVISDYAKGACTPEICQEAIRSGLPVIVDPKGDPWDKYHGATVICPNSSEVRSWDGLMVEKRGALGLRLREREIVFDYPSVARHVFDVTGAGDTVTAVIAACVAKGIAIELACPIANVAAGFVVGEVGTSVCSIEKLRELCA